MREEIIQRLLVLLNNNIGNRLSPELVTGVVVSMDQFMASVEAQNLADKAESCGVGCTGD